MTGSSGWHKGASGVTVVTALFLSLLVPQLVLAQPKPLGPFTFCYGLERGGSPTILRDLGLNTLYIDLLPSDMGDLQPCRDLIQSAKANGLKVIVGLPTCLTDRYRVSPYDENYTGSVTELITYFVSGLKDEPGITGWATGHSLEKSLSTNDADFRAYLRQGYATLDALNSSWGSHFETWAQVSRPGATDADAALPFKVGRASVDVADYQAAAYHDVMALWLRTIRGLDPRRPVLTGRVTLYRSLAAIPDGYDIVCVSMPPDVVEGDLVSHNVQGLDLARRGGKFQVLQVLRVPSNASPAYSEEPLRGWVQEAALHGSVGFGLEDWGLLSEIHARERALRNPKARYTINALNDCRGLRFDFAPRPTTAIVYSPYAEGLEVTSQPLYGFIKDYLPGEPSNLVYALRLGTRYGLVDYLTVGDLENADLDRYGALLLPACLKLPPPQAALLEEYVLRGGALLADLGLGMYDTGSWTALPEPYMRGAGIAQFGAVTSRVLDLTVSTPLPALPLPRALRSRGGFRVSTGATGPANERKPFTVSGPVAEVKLTDDGVPLAVGDLRFDKDKRPIFTGLVGRQTGSGMTLFATHPLWEYWLLGDPLSQALHGALFARRARYELAETGLLSNVVQMSASADEVYLLNLDRQPTRVQVWAYAAENHAYLGAVANFQAAPLQQGLPAGTALLVAAIPEKGVTRLTRAPLIVQPTDNDMTVQIQAYSPQQVVLKVCGAGAVVGGTAARGPDIHGGSTTGVRLVLSTGGYPIAPRSSHQVVMKTRGGQITTGVVTANERGELDLSGNYREDTLTVTPAPRG